MFQTQQLLKVLIYTVSQQNRSGAFTRRRWFYAFFILRKRSHSRCSLAAFKASFQSLRFNLQKHSTVLRYRKLYSIAMKRFVIRLLCSASSSNTDPCMTVQPVQPPRVYRPQQSLRRRRRPQDRGQ